MAGNSARVGSFRGIAFANTRRKRGDRGDGSGRKRERKREIEETEETKTKGGRKEREEEKEGTMRAGEAVGEETAGRE